MASPPADEIEETRLQSVPVAPVVDREIEVAPEVELSVHPDLVPPPPEPPTVYEIESLLAEARLGEERAIRRLMEVGAPAIRPLASLIESTNPIVQIRAINMLGFLRMVANPHPRGVRWPVFGEQQDELHAEIGIAVPAIARALTSQDPNVRRTAINELRDFGNLSAQALPEMKLLLTDDDPFIRVDATQAVMKVESSLKAPKE